MCCDLFGIHNKYQAKSKINPSIKTYLEYLEYSIMILSSVDFCTFVFLTTIKRMIRSYLGTLKTYMVEENASLDFRLKKSR